MEGNERVHTIYIISDRSGITGMKMLESALYQFDQGPSTRVRLCQNVDTRALIDQYMREALATPEPPLILSTLVSEELQLYLRDRCGQEGLSHLDLMTPLFGVLGTLFQASPKGSGGATFTLSQGYFQRIDAIEFTLAHDDGKAIRNLDRADIILLGVSRTSKTPTSMFLAQFGYKVINIPLVPGVSPPPELDRLETRKVVGLTISPTRLLEVRRTRMQRMGSGPGDYVNIKKISEEVAWAEEVFRKHRSWPIIDVTTRSIEESAGQILRHVYGEERTLIR